MTRFTRLIAAVALAGSLGACGYNQGDRALSGAGIGALGGAGVAAVTGGSPLAGAAIGGLGGAAVGALTSPRDVNMGRPAWR